MECTLYTLRQAHEFVGWYRRMVIEGRIVVTTYALNQIPCSDYDLQESLAALVTGEQPSSVTLAGSSRITDAPKTESIETEHYDAVPLGTSWLIRDKRNGQVLAFRPSRAEASAMMEEWEAGFKTA